VWKQKTTPPARSNGVVVKQLLKHIPRSLISEVMRDTGVVAKAREIWVFSLLCSMLFAQLTHAVGLNDVCDWLRLKQAILAGVRAMPPSRNGLSPANKVRPAEFMETLFWRVLERLQNLDPSFAAGKRGRGLLRRFRVRIHAVDSTVMELVANCMDWAKHRRRKAAAKRPLRLNLHSFLPSFAIVDPAGEHDNKRAREVCAGMAAGEIVLFDKAYVDSDHLADLDVRGVWWVTRAKDNMSFRVYRNLAKNEGKIVRDQMVRIDGGRVVRRVEAWVEVDGEDRLMVFITNNPTWSPASVCDLYRRRWDIEVFFKQVKRRSSSAPSSGTAPTLSAGRSSAPCWSAFSCVSRPTSPIGATASPDSSLSCGPPSGNAWTGAPSSAAMGQQVLHSKCSAPSNRRGCLDLRGVPRGLVGQHLPILSASQFRSAQKPQSLFSIPAPQSLVKSRGPLHFAASMGRL
jgi:hypothetical protein